MCGLARPTPIVTAVLGIVEIDHIDILTQSNIIHTRHGSILGILPGRCVRVSSLPASPSTSPNRRRQLQASNDRIAVKTTPADPSEHTCAQIVHLQPLYSFALNKSVRYSRYTHRQTSSTSRFAVLRAEGMVSTRSPPASLKRP